MHLSSKFTVCLGLAVALSSSAAHAELAARPAFAGIRPTIVTRGQHYPYYGIAPTIVGRHDGYPGAGIRPTLVPRYRHGYGRGYAYGGYGLGYDDTMVTDFGSAGYPLPGPGPVAAPPPFAFPAPPPPCPQIIEIGRGLAHKATTRVVSGMPCRR